MTQQQLEWAWRLGGKLLSLDVVLPLYAPMGVEVSKPEVLRDATRTWLAKEGLRAEDLKVASWEGIFRQTLNVRFLQSMIEQSLGKQEMERLSYWMQFVHCTEPSLNPWVVLKRFFSVWAGDVRTQGVDSLGLSLDPIKVATDHRENVVDQDVRLKLPGWGNMSAWDQALFRLLEFPDVPSGSDYVPFEDEAGLTAYMHRFQGFFLRLQEDLSRNDIVAIDQILYETSPIHWNGLDSLPKAT